MNQMTNDEENQKFGHLNLTFWGRALKQQILIIKWYIYIQRACREERRETFVLSDVGKPSKKWLVSQPFTFKEVLPFLSSPTDLMLMFSDHLCIFLSFLWVGVQSGKITFITEKQLSESWLLWSKVIHHMLGQG